MKWQLKEKLKTCEKKMQELNDSIKRQNLRITGIEGERGKQKECVIYSTK
jgi:hypothetical protein